MLIFSSCELEHHAVMPAHKPPFTADAALLALAARKHPPQVPQPLLLYLHGYNSSPAAFFERCDRLQSLYSLEIFRFSWSSKKHLLDDGFCPGFDVGMDLGLQRELARLFGPQADSPSGKYPEPLYPVVGDPEKVTCSWWVLMALPSVRH